MRLSKHLSEINHHLRESLKLEGVFEGVVAANFCGTED
jgi:hypothetical protein